MVCISMATATPSQAIAQSWQPGVTATIKAGVYVTAALSGLVWLTGDPDRPPVRVSTPQSFRLGAAEAAVHTLVALQHASGTGIGQHVDAAAFPAMVRAVMNATQFRLLQGWEMVRSIAAV